MSIGNERYQYQTSGEIYLLSAFKKIPVHSYRDRTVINIRLTFGVIV